MRCAIAKRFTDSRKWQDDWFIDLDKDYKLFWIYLLDTCDHLGIYKPSLSLANFCLKTNLKEDDILRVFNGRILKLDCGKWFIPKFIKFQYGQLSGGSTFHMKIIRELESILPAEIIKNLDRVSTGCREGVDTLKDKDKEKDKVKDKVRVIDKGGVGEEEKEIIDDLNVVLGSNYKLTSNKTNELIRMRLKEGFTVENFKTVHRKMSAAWGLDNKMRQYLRPITLYSNKFESYLNRPADIVQLTPQQQNNLKQLAQLNKEITNDNTSI